MKTCTKCKETKKLAEFCKFARAKDGYQPACKKCMAKAYNASRAKKKEHYLATAQKRRNQIQEQVRNWKSKKGCSNCEEAFGPCLELHHLDPSTKEDNPSNLASVSFESFLKEAEKCIVLCANCHRKVHAGLFSLSFA